MATSAIDYPTTPSQVAQVVIDIPTTPESTIQKESKIMVIISLVVLLVLLFPFIFMDLYLAYTDTSCVSQEVPQISLTLKDWLLVGGYVSVGVFIVMSGMVIRNLETPFIKLVSIVCSLFSMAWSVTGAVLFWSYMDNTLCDSLTRNYVYTKLIMSFVGLFMSCCCSGKKK